VERRLHREEHLLDEVVGGLDAPRYRDLMERQVIIELAGAIYRGTSVRSDGMDGHLPRALACSTAICAD
jgi:hypothetical protein